MPSRIPRLIYRRPELYDDEFRGRKADVALYRRLLRGARSVLELGCGTGRLTIPLSRGRTITGLDSSPEMLERARKKAPALDWRLGDFRRARLGRRYDAVLLAANALQHALSRADAAAALACAARHLRPGGRLLVEVFNPDPARLVSRRRYRHKTFGAVEVDAERSYDPGRRLMSLKLFYSSPGRPDFHMKRMRLRCIVPEELEALCEEAGLRTARRFGDHDGRRFRRGSPRLIVEAVSSGAAGPSRWARASRRRPT